jgi:hypothetical protein
VRHLRAALLRQEQRHQAAVSETATATAVIAFETTTALMPVAIPAADTDLSTLDEIFPEEEIIDSVDAVVLANGTTRIEVSTGS